MYNAAGFWIHLREAHQLLPTYNLLLLRDLPRKTRCRFLQKHYQFRVLLSRFQTRHGTEICIKTQAT